MPIGRVGIPLLNFWILTGPLNDADSNPAIDFSDWLSLSEVALVLF